jgi:hypothetical protein
MADMRRFTIAALLVLLGGAACTNDTPAPSAPPVASGAAQVCAAATTATAAWPDAMRALMTELFDLAGSDDPAKLDELESRVHRTLENWRDAAIAWRAAATDPDVTAALDGFVTALADGAESNVSVTELEELSDDLADACA